VSLHLVGAGAQAGRWLGALTEAGVAFRASESEDAAAVPAALRDPLDLVLVWDDAAGERALAALAAVGREGLAVEVAGVLHPEAEEAGRELLERGAAAVLARDRPERLPAILERILRAVRLETRAELIGRIAHDLNNLLAPIPLAVQLLSRAAGRPPDAGTLDAVDLASRGSMAAVRELSELLVTTPEAAVRVRAKHLLALAARRWRRPPPATAAGPAGVIADYSPDLAQVRVDAVRVLQVLSCLARRALDEAGGGELHLRGRNLERAADPDPRRAAGAGRAAVELRVLCGGSGAEAPAAKAEPPPGPADSLSAVRAVVEAHGGSLERLPAPDGVGFAVVLPAAAAAGPAPRGARPGPR
jgi:nitrogen-specific signal transduction histidine kinase